MNILPGVISIQTEMGLRVYVTKWLENRLSDFENSSIFMFVEFSDVFECIKLTGYCTESRENGGELNCHSVRDVSRRYPIVYFMARQSLPKPLVF